jgi:hypothetical protein
MAPHDRMAWRFASIGTRTGWKTAAVSPEYARWLSNVIPSVVRTPALSSSTTNLSDSSLGHEDECADRQA